MPTNFCAFTSFLSIDIVFEIKFRDLMARSVDTVKTQSPSRSGNCGKNVVFITFAFMPAARWRHKLKNVYTKEAGQEYDSYLKTCYLKKSHVQSK